jgi:hypothetical protein
LGIAAVRNRTGTGNYYHAYSVGKGAFERNFHIADDLDRPSDYANEQALHQAGDTVIGRAGNTCASPRNLVWRNSCENARLVNGAGERVTRACFAYSQHVTSRGTAGGEHGSLIAQETAGLRAATVDSEEQLHREILSRN